MRLLDQNLPGITREIAKACWHATDGIVQRTLDNTLDKDLYRAVRDVFRAHVQAFRYCNVALVCEWDIPQKAVSLLPRHEQFAGEHVHVYLMGPEAAPDLLASELVQKTVRAVVRNVPGQHLHGLAIALQHAVEKAMDRRVFRSERCGDDKLCHANEAHDPWDLRDPINGIRSAS